MNILHISTTDRRGGAARAMRRLHEGLLKLDVDSRLLVRLCAEPDDRVSVLSAARSLPMRAVCAARAWAVNRRVKNAINPDRPPEVFTDAKSRFHWAFKRRLTSADIIHLHWVGLDFFDYDGFFGGIDVRIPVVWTLHDMNAFTGGCHYDAGCGRYVDQCGDCPFLRGKPHDLSHQIWLRKQRALQKAIDRGVRLHIVAPSHWLADCARASSLFRELPVNVIPYGVDTSIFRKLATGGVREAFGIPESAKVILFVADGLSLERKGFSVLLDALRMLPIDRRQLCLLCVGDAGHLRDSQGLPICFTGQVSSDQLLALFYSTADLFVIPSREDNLPNTVLEAIACGTPVVGTGIGGIPDMVRPDETGVIVPPGDPAALADAIRSLLEDDERRRRMGAMCRDVVLRDYTLERQATAYRELYAELLGRGA